MRYKPLVSLLTFLILLSVSRPNLVSRAQGTIQFTANHASLEFPDRITFEADIQNGGEIQDITLEYGTSQITCGTVIAKAFPDFEAGDDLSVSWTWEMKQSGSLPPGAQIWWRWVVTSPGGAEQTTEKQTVTWLDNTHPWETISGGNINLHWYSGGSRFGNDLHNAAVDALAGLVQSTGIAADAPVDLYIYATTDDMREAVLYEPGWTGGLAYPEHSIVIIGISPDQIEWGKDTEAHELTHVLVGRETFTCLGFMPTWLVEGLAVYGEGGLDSAEQDNFDSAVAADTLIAVRSLSGGFSEDPDKADLSYSQSYTLVNFLITEYGQADMQTFLDTLQAGATVDDALRAVYGFDIEGFEDTWRAKIGAAPRIAAGQAPPTPTPTAVPTIVPVSGIPIIPTAGPTRPAPTASPTATVAAVALAAASPTPVPENLTVASIQTGSGITLQNGIAFFVFVALFCGFIIFLIVRSRQLKEAEQ